MRVIIFVDRLATLTTPFGLFMLLRSGYEFNNANSNFTFMYIYLRMVAIFICVPIHYVNGTFGKK